MLSKDHLPLDKAFWPKKDDTLFVELKVKNRLYLELAIPNPPYHSLELLSYYDGFVNGFHKEGLRFITNQLTPVFIHESQYDNRLPIGTKRSLKVIHESSKGYTGTLLQSKETKRLSDADVILSYLELHKKMPLDASSTSETIEKTFSNESKSVQKSFLGYLYKQEKLRLLMDKQVLFKGMTYGKKICINHYFTTENFAQWYTDVCIKAELMSYSDVKGFIIYRPYGYAIWEKYSAIFKYTI